METTIKINLGYAQKAYEAITDDRYLEENTRCEYPDVWIIDEPDEDEHRKIMDGLILQLESFGIPSGEYEIALEGKA
jgi:hypothetical protein